MNILLCRPPFVDINFGPPIGLMYLSSILKEAGHHVAIYDLNLDLYNRFPAGWKYDRNFEIPDDHIAVNYANEHLKTYINQIMDNNPDVVGFNLMYCNFKFGLKMARLLSKHTRCIAGGPQATFNEVDMLKSGFFDAVVSGYGEEAILKALKTKGVISHKLRKDRDYLPDLSLVSIDDYSGFLPLVTTRGCPNRCNFCTQHLPYYYHRINSVIQVIKQAGQIKRIMINDSNLNVNTKRTVELFSRLSQECNGAPIHIFGTQVKKGFEQYIPLMAEAGVREVRLGIESGSPRERKSMNKPIFDNKLVIEMVKELTAHRITTWTQFIFCYPDQTEEDRQQTLDLMNQINHNCNPNYIKHFWYQFVVHHGSEQFFKTHYGVKSISPNTWFNNSYNPEVIKKLGQKYQKLIPSNCQLFVDFIEAN